MNVLCLTAEGSVHSNLARRPRLSKEYLSGGGKKKRRKYFRWESRKRPDPSVRESHLVSEPVNQELVITCCQSCADADVHAKACDWWDRWRLFTAYQSNQWAKINNKSKTHGNTLEREITGEGNQKRSLFLSEGIQTHPVRFLYLY